MIVYIYKNNTREKERDSIKAEDCFGILSNEFSALVVFVFEQLFRSYLPKNVWHARGKKKIMPIDVF